MATLTPAYRAALRYWQDYMRTHGWTCRRCGKPIPSGDRKAWDLGHDVAAKHGGDSGFEPECPPCNRAGGADLTNHKPIGASRDWW